MGPSGGRVVRLLDIQKTRSPNSEFQIICLDVDTLPQRMWGLILISPNPCLLPPLEGELNLVTRFQGIELGKGKIVDYMEKPGRHHLTK